MSSTLATSTLPRTAAYASGVYRPWQGRPASSSSSTSPGHANPRCGSTAAPAASSASATAGLSWSTASYRGGRPVAQSTACGLTPAASSLPNTAPPEATAYETALRPRRSTACASQPRSTSSKAMLCRPGSPLSAHRISSDAPRLSRASKSTTPALLPSSPTPTPTPPPRPLPSSIRTASTRPAPAAANTGGRPPRSGAFAAAPPLRRAAAARHAPASAATQSGGRSSGRFGSAPPSVRRSSVTSARSVAAAHCSGVMSTARDGASASTPASSCRRTVRSSPAQHARHSTSTPSAMPARESASVESTAAAAVTETVLRSLISRCRRGVVGSMRGVPWKERSCLLRSRSNASSMWAFRPATVQPSGSSSSSTSRGRLSPAMSMNNRSISRGGRWGGREGEGKGGGGRREKMREKRERNE
eukprot:Rhum_TRINITY_DN13424_c2_g1::Rhum_TRINITY_DN13424_c2_g1_i1::g.59829::m.59829